MQASTATAAAASAPPGVAPGQGGFDRFLLEVPLLAGLDAAGLAEVQRLLRPFDVQAGGVLFRQGDASDGLYLIKEGEIAIMRRVPGDETVQLAVLGRCATVGEMGLLDHGVRSASAVAVTASTGFFVSCERFEIGWQIASGPNSPTSRAGCRGTTSTSSCPRTASMSRGPWSGRRAPA